MLDVLTVWASNHPDPGYRQGARRAETLASRSFKRRTPLENGRRLVEFGRGAGMHEVLAICCEALERSAGGSYEAGDAYALFAKVMAGVAPLYRRRAGTCFDEARRRRDRGYSVETRRGAAATVDVPRRRGAAPPRLRP